MTLGFVPDYATTSSALLLTIHDYSGGRNLGTLQQQSPHLLAGVKGEDQEIPQTPHPSLASAKPITAQRIHGT